MLEKLLVVRHVHHQILAGPARGDVDTAALWRVFDCIREKVLEHYADQALVRARLEARGDAKFEAASRVFLPNVPEEIRGNRAQVQ